MIIFPRKWCTAGLVAAIWLLFLSGLGGQDLFPDVIDTEPADSRRAAGDLVESVLWRGIDAMYSYRFQEAEEALDSAMAMAPDDPVAPFIAIANHWLRNLTEQGPRKSHEALFRAIDATLPKYAAMVDRVGPLADILLFYGSAYGLRARVALSEKRWTSVIYSGLKGRSLIYEAYAKDSTLTDALLPMGVFNYYTGISSAPVQLVARMFGMTPDRERGIRELQQAAREAPYAWIESASTLAILYMYIENDPAMAYRYAAGLARHYPQSYYFNFLKAEGLVRTHRTATAREFMPRLRALFDTSHPNQRLEWDLKYASLEAELAYQAGDLERALERCQWIIDNYAMEFDWHLGFALYLRGKIQEHQGNLAGAREDYRRVIKLGNQTYAMDAARNDLERLKR